jgi:hypothetical protein
MATNLLNPFLMPSMEWILSQLTLMEIWRRKQNLCRASSAYRKRNREKVLFSLRSNYWRNAEKRRAYTKEWHKRFPEKSKAWAVKNREKINAKARIRAKKYPEKIRASQRRYHAKHKRRVLDKLKVYIAKRCATDPAFKLKRAIRSQLNKAINRKQISFRSREILGCDFPELKTHLEGLFVTGMTWDNWGNGGGFWNIDHKRPISSFDLTDPDQVKACFHFSNLQPLWWIDNMRKSNKILEAV